MALQKHKAVLVYSLLGFLPLASSALLFPINARYLQPADYGVVAQADVIRSFLVVLLSMGLAEMTFRFYLDYGDRAEDRRRYLGHLMGQLVLQSAFFAGVFALVGPWLLPAVWGQGALSFADFGWFIFVFAGLTAGNTLLANYYRAAENLRMALLVGLLPMMGLVVGTYVGIVQLGLGALGNVGGKAIGVVVCSVPIYLLVVRQGGLRFDRSIWRGMWQSSLMVVPYGLLGVSSQVLDKVLVGNIYDETELGLYSMASIIVLPVGVLLLAYWNAIGPEMYRLMRTVKTGTQVEAEAASQAVRSSYRVVFMLGLLLILLAIGLAAPALRLLASESYYAAARYVPVLAVAFIGRAGYVVFTLEVFYEKKTQLLSLSQAVGVGASLGFALLANEWLGVLGIGLSQLVYQLSLTATVLLLWRGKYVVHYASGRVVLLSAVLLLAVGYGYVQGYSLLGVLWYNLLLWVLGSGALAAVAWPELTQLAAAVRARLGKRA